MNEFFTALKNKRARREYIKSILVGGVSVAIDFVLQALILYLFGRKEYDGFWAVFTGKTVTGVPYQLPLSIYMTSIVISFVVSVLLNYILSIKFVYQYGNVGRNKKGFLKFAIFALIGLAITLTISLVSTTVVKLEGFDVWIIKIITTVAVSIFNFFTRKYFVFNIALIIDDENTINL